MRSFEKMILDFIDGLENIKMDYVINRWKSPASNFHVGSTNSLSKFGG